MTEPSNYVLTEIWKARNSWLALPTAERSKYFEDIIGPFIDSMVRRGAEFLGCAINDNTGTERIDYRYMAVWKLPDKTFSDELEAGARAAGFLQYFDQVNFSGALITPNTMNADMIGLGS